MHAALLFAVVAFAGESAPAEPPLVVEDVDLIAVAHVADGRRVAVFFGRVQEQPAQLAHRWAWDDAAPVRDGDGWAYLFFDAEAACWRLVRTPAWIETWSEANPLADAGRPWFAGLCEPGLKQP